MQSLHVKKGDAVMIVAGKDKNKSGVVLKTSPKDATVIVDGLNLVHKTKKARNAQERNEITQIPAPINASNVMPICSTCGKVTRIGHKVEKKDGKDVKIRVCKKCGASLEIKAAKAKSTAKRATRKKKETVEKTESEN